MADIPRMTVEELRKRIAAGGDITIVDVRNPIAWGQSDTMIPGALRIPLDELEENLSRIPQDRPVVAYCT